MGESMTDSKRPSPPKFVVRTISALLPPDRREQILGDLEERFREARWGLRTLRFIRDANSILPRILWQEVKRFDTGPRVPARLPVERGEDAVRAQVEGFQHQEYCRYLFYFGMVNAISLLVLVPFALKAHNATAILPLMGILVVLRFTADQHRRRGGGMVVPAGDSLKELVAFHRRALMRRRKFLRGLWYWKLLPLLAPWIVVRVVQGRVDEMAGLLCLYVAAIVAVTWSAARRVQQGIEALPPVVD